MKLQTATDTDGVMMTTSATLEDGIISAFSRGEALTEEQHARVRRARTTAGRFARLREAADVLAAGSAPPLWRRALGTELFRTQFEFNHTLVDVLEDWPFLASRASCVDELRARLDPWASWRLLVPRRDGLFGTARYALKTLGTQASALLLSRRLTALAKSNQLLTEAVVAPPEERAALLKQARDRLEARSPFEVFFAAQRAFVDQLQRFFDNISPPPRPDGERILQHADWYIHLPKGETWLGVPPTALRANVDLIFGDSRCGDELVFRPQWSREHLWSETFIGAFMMRKTFADAHGLTQQTPALAWLLCPSLTSARTLHARCVVSTRSTPADKDPRDIEIIEKDLRRINRIATIETEGTSRRVRVQPAHGTRVSIIVPFKNKLPLLKGLLRSFATHTPGVDWELILVSNNSNTETLRYLNELRNPRVRWFEWNRPFNYSELNNVAARRASGDLLLFLNNDIEARHANWLADLAGYAQLPGVAAVGARLLYADGSIQHAGVVLGLRLLAGHIFARWRPEDGTTPFGSPETTRPWSAVTGACLMLQRARFEEVGGFDEAMRVSGSDIDLCLRATRQGERVICVSHAQLTHFESQSRGRSTVPLLDVRNEARAYGRALLDGDPWYHPALSLEIANCHEPAAQTPIDHTLTVLSALDPSLLSPYPPAGQLADQSTRQRRAETSIQTD